MNQFYVACVLFLQTSLAQTHPKSCEDLYKADTTRQRGEYMIYNNQGQSFNVFCDFYNNYGYTYISPATTIHIDIDNLYTDSDHVLIRDRRKDGHQYEARMEQIHDFQSIPLSIQYNAHTGYNGIQNPTMTPYLYLGFTPAAMVKRGQTEGYKINGNDHTFRNCDGNANSYFAFLFNQNNVAPSSYHSTTSTIQKLWIDGATQVAQNHNIPDSYFSFFEMHFGGCGAYGTPQHLPQASGAALGLRYDINCTVPVDIQHGTKSYTSTSVGASVTYTCEVGYTQLAGDLARQCAPTGNWTGQQPQCGSFPCDSRPCYNGGMCFEVEGANYVCECLEGFGGAQCQTPL